MTAYIIRRLLYVIPVVFGVALVLFVLFHMVGGDPTYQMLGKHANETVIQELRTELGLNKPYHLQFVDYLKQIATFDYGRSFSSGERISDIISRKIEPSISLAIPAFLLTLIIAISTSLLICYFRGSWIDKILVVICVAMMSIPYLGYIIFGQHFLAFELGLFPISGYESDWSVRFSYLLLPIVIWITASLGVDIRYFRTAILDEVNQDYVRTARAKGLKESIVFLKHVLKNSLIPILTYVVIQIPFLILGSLLLENFFGIPGLGSLTIDAVNNSDFPVLKAMSTLFSIFFVVGQLVTDILYKIVDPRVTLQ